MNHVTPEVYEVALSYLEGLSCPRSLTVALLLKYNEVAQLVELECKPSSYLTADDYLDAVASTDLLRKVEFDLEGVDRKANAIAKWEWAERECFKTNRRLDELESSDGKVFLGCPAPDAMTDFIHRAKKRVRELIGPTPPADWKISGRFGPGATVSDSARRTTVLHKMSSTPTLTLSALGYLFPWMETKWAKAVSSRDEEVRFVKGNSFFSVPKSSLTHRPCAKEPSVNSFYQLAYGQVMRERLLRRGIDLVNGQSIHRQVACAASKDGELCTIDLTSASDTMSSVLVKLLLPTDWYQALDSVRSHYTLIEGKWKRLEKFSSMGNGFTFELETALFEAIVHTASRGDPRVWVYGDDIIAPTEYGSEILAALKFFGFTPNPSKTYLDGHFRESCGGDFFSGVAVRPFQIKELPNEPQDYIVIANGIRRLAVNNGRDPTRFARLRRSWFRCLDSLPSTIRGCRGPEALGDLVIHDDERHWCTRWRSSIRYVRVYRPARFKRTLIARFDPDVILAGALYGMTPYPKKWDRPRPDGSNPDGRGLIPRDGVSGYKVGWVPFS